MPCTICNHPKRPDIDQALIAGSVTLAALSQKYGLSTSALHRHKAHLEAKVSRAQAQLQDNLRQGYIFQLSQFLEMAMQTAQAAQAEGNFKLVLQAIAQGTRLIKIILKQDFPLDSRLVYEILVSPQWATQAGLLPNDPQILAAGRQALAETLSSHCPDSAPAPTSPDPLQDLESFTETLLNLAQQVAPLTTASQNLETENHLFRKREKSGKLPGKTSLRKDNNVLNQQDNLINKIAGKNSSSSQPGAWLQELDAGRLDIETLNAIGAGRPVPATLDIFKPGICP
jgi:hypothetical protein